MALWSVPLRVVVRCSAEVEADSMEDATRKANEADWLDSGLSAGEWSDWGVDGTPECVDADV